MNDSDLEYQPSSEFETFLRENSVPFFSAVCSFEPNGRVFDAHLGVSGDQALEAWLKLRKLVGQFPHWPVIGEAFKEVTAFPRRDYLDPGGRWSAWSEQYRKDRDKPPPPPEFTPDIIRADARANIAAAAHITPTPWQFRSQRQHSFTPTNPGMEADLPVSELQLDELLSNRGPFFAPHQGNHPEWPFHPFVTIRLFPTDIPWEVFAYQPFGGWNDAPWPDEMLTMFRHWYNRHGAEVVAVGFDWVEVLVERPPRTRQAAAQLIDELRWFGEDSPMQSLPRDADPFEYISKQHYWYFWWD